MTNSRMTNEKVADSHRIRHSCFVILITLFSLFPPVHSLESRQPQLRRRAAILMVSPPVAIGQMGHDFQHQKIGPRHHVPRAAIAKRTDELFEYLHMQLHRPLR